LRALTAQRGGELLQMRFSDLHNRGTHWIKPFVIRKRKKTAVRQDDQRQLKLPVRRQLDLPVR
jgi:integrase